MDKKLHLLETFTAKGNDGRHYKVHAYEHLARDPSLIDAEEHWEPTGITEYKLADGYPLKVETDGTMFAIGKDLRLTRRSNTH
jgi:hypothetical protein